jgi:poly(3-hydroxybutyrate) depolymerase
MVLVPLEKEGTPKPVGGPMAIEPAAVPFHAAVNLADIHTGDYNVEVRLAADGGTPEGAARAAFVKTLPIHLDTLSASVEQLRGRLAKAPRKDGVATAEYTLALYDRADAGEVNPSRVDFREAFASANAILTALDQGKDAFGKHGDSHRAYRSAVDNTLQPYRLFIPEKYDGSKPAPLVVALHGMGGDENSMFDSYGNGLLKREAERLGFLVVCPKGRDTASMYRGSAEQDVLDVLADVQHTYRVDPARIYLMGHSMGAYGTWSIAMAHPEIFAALGPISGGGSTAGMVKIRHIPQYVVHGDDDRTVAVTQSRNMVEAGKKAGAEIVYVEVPGGSHVGVAAPAFAAMLDFFAQQKKSGEHQ